jgi:hypothetical protein
MLVNVTGGANDLMPARRMRLRKGRSDGFFLIRRQPPPLLATPGAC